MAGFWKNLLGSLGGNQGTAFFTPNVTYLGADEYASIVNPESLTAAQMWRTQPHFRTVVTFLARNIAQLGLHSFERVGETDRRRDRSSVLARALAEVDGQMTTYELIYALVGDLALYDRAYWWAAPSSDTSSGWMIRRLPPTWVSAKMSDPWTVSHYELSVGGKTVEIPAEEILAFPGFDPARNGGASPTVEALRQTLQEQVEAAKYRGQIWKRGGRVSSVLERPADAPQWSDNAREAFREDWYSKYTGNGSRAGGTPILEDGMSLKRVDFSASEQQYVEAAKLSLATVAAAFHVNPTMVGQLDSANYSNVREFRKMLYGDTLGPMLAQIESRINSFLVARMGLDPATHYVEFNIQEKLQGNFEEQSQALQSSTGAPWMTRNEARALQNLPSLEGGDELITPLNVLVGGQASPQDAGSQNVTGEASVGQVSVKAARDFHDDQGVFLVRSFFSRQARSVLSRLGADSSDWWDKERWDDELTDILSELQRVSATSAGRKALADAGINPGAYNERQTVEFLAEAARVNAESINEATRERVVAAEDPAEELNASQAGRAAAIAAGVVTFAAGFGAVEAARQRGGATKTWVVTSSNPRDSHRALDGETVGIDDTFSNGLRWPGAFGPADETAGCMCDLQINFPDA